MVYYEFYIGFNVGFESLWGRRKLVVVGAASVKYKKG